MIDEGYIKFKSRWNPGPPPEHPLLPELIRIRNLLFADGLIGIYHDSGIGFGNVSLRAGLPGEFIISGTRTGGIARLESGHFTRVTRAVISANLVECTGPVEASSESMTHAMLYACRADIGAVVHVHHPGMWEWLPGKVPASDPSVAYGTPEMAEEVKRLFRETEVARSRMLVMGGHEEGIIAFGKDPEDAAAVVRAWWSGWKEASRV
jgi:ribulose-5-phosphate 4-epimerase/fuculose-1-phosphate aldolase